MRFRLALTALLVSLGTSGRDLQAQDAEHDNRDLGGCLRTFYDPDMYNWFSFENTCDEPVYIVFCERGGTRRCHGALTLRPGRKDSIGRSRSEIAAWGGVSAYSCPAGYAPDVNGQYPLYGGERYACKRQ